MQKTSTFLMFAGSQAGKAEEAMTFYTSLFSDSRIKTLVKYQNDEPGGKKGMTKYAEFVLCGQEYLAIDSSAPHAFGFTPAVSIFVRCGSEAEIESLFGQLAKDGVELMPLGDYGFSRRFGWVNDRFGVSWQLDLRD